MYYHHHLRLCCIGQGETECEKCSKQKLFHALA
jgi:hypothetical protein